ncbi:hypothetical protein AKO1_008293 [Acrasis kona]|uniref:Amidase domain-containing protein n=1 Tax=Acrasis kona TaxID=1008807 RepID=A0AAW2YP47_9EUKA
MARSMEDIALCMDVLAKEDEEDWLSCYPGRRDTLIKNPYTTPEIGSDVKGLKVAVSLNLGGYVKYVHQDVMESIKSAVDVFEKNGAIVTFVDDDFPLSKFDLYKTYKVLWLGGVAHLLKTKKDSDDLTEAEIKELMDEGLYTIGKQGEKYTAVEAMHAEQDRAKMGVAMNKFYRKYDVLVTPTLPIPPFEANKEVPSNIEQIASGRDSSYWEDADMVRFWGWTPLSYVFNMTKQPCGCIPCGSFKEGNRLPISMQVVGPLFGEDVVLKVCNSFQKHTSFHRRVADQQVSSDS